MIIAAKYVLPHEYLRTVFLFKVALLMLAGKMSNKQS